MTSTLSCEALRDDLIALLYDDGDPADQSRARDHLAQCVPCRLEYADLKGVRKALRGWELPVPVAVPQTRAPRRWFATGLAAAAGLILGIGVALAGRSAFTPASVESAPATTAGAEAARQFVSFDQLQEVLKAQEARHQTEIAELRRSLTMVSESPASVAAVGTPGQLKNASNLSPATIERLLKASEERQARMIEARLAGLRTETDLQRQYDMAQIAAGLAYIDSRTGADAARTSELMKNLVRVTAKPQDR